MSRIIDGFEQFFDASGDPLVSGKLYFYESGSGTTLKDTYSDLAETNANSNPVILNGDGRCPNVFGPGSYRVILTDSDDVQLVQRDPVGGVSGITFGVDWNAIQIYGITDVVRDAGSYWISQIDNNQNHQPSLDDGTNWIPYGIEFGADWNSIQTYAENAVVLEAGVYWISNADANKGNQPSTDDGTYWDKYKDNKVLTSTITPASDADVTLTRDEYSSDVLILADGAWTANHNIIVPNEERIFVADNSSGSYAATVKTSAGNGVEILSGHTVNLYCDGTDVKPTGSFQYKRTVSKVSSGTFIWSDTGGCRAIRIIGIAGGGGGGAVDGQGAGTLASAEAGACGAYTERWIEIDSTYSATYTVGAAGSGGAAGANDGTAGGNSTWSDGTNSITLTGGAGGKGKTAANSAWRMNTSGAQGGTATPFSVYNKSGANSLPAAIGVVGGTQSTVSFTAPNSPLGQGGLGVSAGSGAVAGNNASGFGAPGSGAGVYDVAGNEAGGNGSQGIWIVEEYY